MLRRMSASPPSWSLRCRRIAPQQPASSAHQRLDAGGVEHARGRAVDVGHHRRLHAAEQQQHLARDARACGQRCARAGAGGGTLAFSTPGSSGRTIWPSLQRRREQRRGQAFLQRQRSSALAAAGARTRSSTMRRPISTRLPYCTPDGQVVSQLRQVRQRSRCSCVARVGACALEHLLDQVDAAARAVELVAEQLVGRAGRGAEAAVHALAQDGLGLDAVGGAGEFGGEVRSASGRDRRSEAGVEAAGVEDAVRDRRRASAARGSRAAAAAAARTRRPTCRAPRNSVAWPPTRGRGFAHQRRRQRGARASAGAPCHSISSRRRGRAAARSAAATGATGPRPGARSPRRRRRRTRRVWSRRPCQNGAAGGGRDRVAAELRGSPPRPRPRAPRRRTHQRCRSTRRWLERQRLRRPRR